MSIAGREKQLRAMAQLEVQYHLESYDFLGVSEAAADCDLDLAEAEADYVFDLIRMATPTLPDRKLEDYL